MDVLQLFGVQEEHQEVTFQVDNFSLVDFDETHHTFIPKRYDELMISRAKLSEIVEFGEKRLYTVFRELDLSRFNFSNLEMEYVIFENCEIYDANFEDATLTTVRFINCSLARSKFDRTKLNYVKLWKSNLKDATFEESILINLYGFLADFTNVDFTRAIVYNAYVWIGNFKGAKANPESGFRTKKGGDGARYEVPVCKPPCPASCMQACSHNTNPNRHKLAYEK